MSAGHTSHEKHHQEHHALVPTIILGAGFFALMVWLSPMLTLQKTDLVMIVVGAILFVALVIALNAVLFKPFLQLLEAREAATSGAVAGALSIVDQTKRLRAQYDEHVQQARVRAMQQKNETLLLAKAEAAKIVEKADLESQELVRNARWANAQKAEKVRAEIKTHVDTLAQTLITRIEAA